MTRVGILGGTFNPVHLGHLRAAEEVCEAQRLDQVLLVPSAEPPHKRSTREDPVAPAELRLEWARAACRDNPRIAVDDLEIVRGGASYTVETLGEIGARTAPVRPVFVIGCDAFAELGTWREPREILRLADFAVMTRPRVSGVGLEDWLPPELSSEFVVEADGRSARHPTSGAAVRLVEISALDISSSDIRLRLRAGRSIRYLVPEVVREGVEKSGVYTRAGAG